MAFLDAKEWQFGRQNVFGVTTGAADLPNNNLNGLIQVGDWALNLSGMAGQPPLWVVSAASSSSVTWQAAGSLGIGYAIRTSATSTTLASTDTYLIVTAPGTVTLPAPSTTLATHDYTIKAFGQAAQPVTVVAASGGNLDNVTLGTQTLTANEAMNIITDGVSNWYTVGRDPLQQVKTQAAPYTVSSTQDKYVIVSNAGTITMPASTIWPIGSEVVIHATTSSCTITSASGTFNGGAALTLAANANYRIFTDGANYFTAN